MIEYVKRSLKILSLSEELTTKYLAQFVTLFWLYKMWNVKNLIPNFLYYRSFQKENMSSSCLIWLVFFLSK